MNYVCYLGSGQRLDLANQGSHTVITLSQSGPGQQQQSTNRYLTGTWTAQPTVMQAGGITVITVFSATKTTQITVQGQAIALCEQPLNLQGAQSLPLEQTAAKSPELMSPLEPLPPLKMGNMEMKMKPMEMRLGNMEMRINDLNQPAQQQPTPAANSAANNKPKRFCGQCGQAITAGDRFCTQCGQPLSP
ncbi:zinc-ribbon domain-containing protein [Picosynechococcus sp. PCC 8807]|uniref:zinc-ribbon domain-containing protein n=1 Tax=Picosynechococcus sp. PCC 8807 TaxID=195248 RepID=UPI000810977C|nr:zinc ribbon domain-containing protein [Picosynechococcus sp. PCC 8807]ANV89580.1 hypothetical protein AWQ24_02420 [Picosynechococcus sp. PCC 8807]